MKQHITETAGMHFKFSHHAPLYPAHAGLVELRGEVKKCSENLKCTRRPVFRLFGTTAYLAYFRGRKKGDRRLLTEIAVEGWVYWRNL